ncbi:hypothetical protein [Solidesulfovibrio carbinolicus]|uniref:Uncharacterized protein n=1 Tax=Solidesulfovibrio carbinolicus TaxID=296842 RepID=A0A4P6HMB1_9BACT|nr:hypothetical protein [Solidesulfovibrio carbinolicus]QAZ67090.1 hypothetical protein C3Y92_07555 [Solidesulfovibrio carbinolicus]
MALQGAAGSNDAHQGQEPAGGFVPRAVRLLHNSPLRWAALAVVVALQGVLFLSGYRLTPDQLALHRVSMLGFDAILTESVAAAVVSGRFCFFFSPLSYYAELLSDYFVVRALYVGVYFGLLWTFAAYWARLVRAEAATLLLLLLVSLQILDFNNLPPNSFTIAFTLPALLLVCSRRALLAYDEALAQASTAKRLALFAVVLTAYLASDYVFIFGVSLLLLEYALAWWRGQGGLIAKGKALIWRRKTWFDAAPVALAALAYGGWRLLHPPAYAGTTLAATFDPALVLATAAAHAMGGFTLARPELYAVLAANASSPPGGWLPLVGVFVGSAFLGAATLHGLRGLAYGKRLTAACLGLALFVVLPLALSPKYQQLQLEHLPAYVDSRFAFLWATAALACLVCLLGKHLGHGARRLVLSLLFGVILGAASAYTYSHNADMSQAMLEYTAAWDRAGSLAAEARGVAGPSGSESGLNDSIAARVDPLGLVAGHPEFDLEAYWRQYVAWREARRDDAWFGVSLGRFAVRPVTLTPGRLYAAAELPRRFYGRAGWYWPAAWGVYSRGERACLPFEGVAPGKDGVLAFTAGGVLAPGRDSQALEVWVNGQRLATLGLTATPAVQQVAVPGELLKGGLVTFEFRVGRPFSPASLGGEDHRRLGFALLNVLFVQP